MKVATCVSSHLSEDLLDVSHQFIGNSSLKLTETEYNVGRKRRTVGYRAHHAAEL